ncbi:SUR7/PalI family-domain-containing protein [Scheffersomyces coipomensis]|uniref:SUR7/PalI family-domain-containing protein n=1 Tax=Scheffersomyces coipomensis TaxID=1788519 RepID=UPI00315CED1E
MAFKLSFNSLSFILILVSFVFLLLATISSPIVQSFNLGKTSSHTYGIFGYCDIKSNTCSTATYPYSLSSAKDDTSNWFLSSSSTRDNLAKIFIIAPIALGFNFITLILIIASHFQIKPVIIAGIVFNLLAFILTTLITVIVIIVFYPNLAWTSWILIGAAAATLISFVLMILTLLYHQNDSYDDDDEDQSSDVKFPTFNNSAQVPTSNNFNSTFTGPTNYTNLNTNNNNNNHNDSGSSSIEKDYEYKPHIQTQPIASSSSQTYDRSMISNNSNNLYNSKPQLANDFTTSKPLQQPYYNPITGSEHNSKLSLIQNSNTIPQPSQQQQQTSAPYPQNQYPTSVFEHHPEVEGHKPFTELDDEYYHDVDEDLLDENAPLRNGSDVDSDFTSVSQRAVNPKFYGHQVSPPQHQPYYPSAQPYQPHFQQQQIPIQPQLQPPLSQSTSYYNASPQQPPPPQQQQQQQQRGPTISDNVLSQNPDFAIGPAKRRMQPGFVPVAARNKANQQASASALMGRRNGSGSGSGVGGSGPYGSAY